MNPLQLSKTFGWKLYGIPKTFEGISINSKTVKVGNLFVPLKGKKFDGHLFIEEAIRKDAVGFLFESSKLDKNLIKKLTARAFALEVKDTFKALQTLARLRREFFKGKEIIAITGTAGKSTTKELIAHLLKGAGTVYKTEGNLNSQVGLPLTVAAANERVDFWVLEMGASEKGNIKRLVEIAKPTLSVLTSLGFAHLEGFGNFQNLILAKGEIFLGKEVRKAVLPQEALFYYKHLLENKRTETFKGLPFYRFTSKGRTAINLYGKRVEVNLLGEGIVKTILVASKVLEILELPVRELLLELLPFFRGLKGRMQPILGKDFLVIDDSYNANPLSMEAALNTLIKVEGYDRRVAILGDMLELGDIEVKAHRDLGLLLEKLPISEIYLFGRLTRHTCGEIKSKPCHHFEDKEKLLKRLKAKEPRKGSVYLVKGSRSLKMEEVLEIFIT